MTTLLTSRAIPHTASPVPVYKLYGEDQWPTPDMVHCESIAARSRLHDWQIRLHRHHGLMQWLYLRGGQARTSLDGRYVDLSPGVVVVVPHMYVHGFQFAPDAQGYVITLGNPLIERLGKNIQERVHIPAQPRVLRVPSADQAVLDMAFTSLQTEYQSSRLHRDTLIDTMLTSVLVWVSRQVADDATANATRATDRSQRHFLAFCELIETHYAQPWAVAQYADKVGVTPAHLNVLCRENVGQSALSLIHQRRLLEAKRLLVYTSLTVSGVSDALGFSDPAYFTRFFKRLTGLSPKAFRDQAVSMIEG